MCKVYQCLLLDFETEKSDSEGETAEKLVPNRTHEHTSY